MTVNGLDVSPVTYWRSTMMGNASKDPFWRAVVAEEVHQISNITANNRNNLYKMSLANGIY